jgi:hypothetical protein
MKQATAQLPTQERTANSQDELQITEGVRATAVRHVQERLGQTLEREISFVKSLRGVRAEEYNEGWPVPMLEKFQRQLGDLDLTPTVEYAFQQVTTCLQSQQALHIREADLPRIIDRRGIAFEDKEDVYDIAFGVAAEVVNQGAQERSTARSEGYVAGRL